MRKVHDLARIADKGGWRRAVVWYVASFATANVI